MIKVRVLNYRPLTKIKLLKANMYDKLVTIMGTVTRVSVARPFITRLAFECTKCNTTFVRLANVVINSDSFFYLMALF